MKLSLLFSLVGLSVASFSVQAVQPEPEKRVHDFYHEYLNADNNEVLASLVETYVSKPLIKSLNTSAMCNYGNDDGQKVCETDCDIDRCFYYNVWIETDVNYFTKSQDTYPDWERFIKTKLIFNNDATAQVDVILGGIPEHKVRYSVFLIQSDEGWKIWQVDK